MCGAVATVAGAFVPNDPHDYSDHAPRAGKVRSFVYGLCEHCAACEGVAEHVEERIIRERGWDAPVQYVSDADLRDLLRSRR